MSRIYLCFWVPQKPADAANRKRLGEAAAKCFSDVQDAIEKNLHLWEEKEALRNAGTSTAIVNIPAEKYKGGELLLVQARKFDRRPARKPIEWGAALPLRSVGHLYASAATMFFVSCESFINLLYKLLLREEFKGGTYDRLTVRSDLDLRLVSMHVFCRGFSSQTVKPGSDLWERMKDLRDFRNDIVHGNITEEHNVHALEEDGFMFFYSPAADFRGHHRSKGVPPTLTRSQARINEATVVTTKQTVDDLRDAILGAMDDNTREWVNSWLWQPFIPNVERLGDESLSRR